MNSKYLQHFRRLVEEGKDSYKLVGDYILVERIPDSEKKTAGGIVIPDSPETHKELMSAEKPVFAFVLAVGEGYYDEEGNSVELGVVPGDVVLLGPVSTTWFKNFGSLVSSGVAVGVTRESEIKMIFKGAEGYEKVFSLLGHAT